MEGRYVWALLLITAGLHHADVPAHPNPSAVIVHEWGTFTSLQDEAGQAIGGINTDDEPVPQFVHQLWGSLLLTPTELPPSFFSKGAPACHPDVTIRLETPVLYFHLPQGQSALHGVTVTAQFRGGWLTEFSPDAHAVAPGAIIRGAFGHLGVGTTSTLTWDKLEVGGNWRGPPTVEHVWTSPRSVQADPVRIATGESERFLFYRGVGHIDAPIAVAQDAVAAELVFRRGPSTIAGRSAPELKSLWLVDIQDDGKLAFRALAPITLNGTDEPLARVSSRFAPEDYSEANRETLKELLRESLVAEGLFHDEAQALLDTWELSYFKSGGMRVFFMVPREWTDAYLPISISVPAQITRVMVGRIELVTPAQRSYLQQISQLSEQDITADSARLQSSYDDQVSTKRPWDDVARGKQSLADYGVTIPGSYQLYLALGRFRNALILDEAQKHPSPSLDHFISTYHLEGYRPVEPGTANR